MVYCQNCGQKLEENFYFCPKCGAKTKAGAAAGVAEPWESIREAFMKAGEEMRKAFAEARTEVKAHRTAKSALCSNCGANNPSGAKFCQKCGKPLS